MTTSQTPLRILKQQADKIAATLKAAERGEKIDVRFAEKIEAARQRDSFSVGIVMDDKVIKIDIPWETVRVTSQVGLSEWIVREMRGSRDTQH